MKKHGCNFRIQAALFGLSKRVRQGVESRLASTVPGVTILQYAIMCNLQTGDLTINELARRMMIKPPSLVAAVDTLERAGYLRRLPDPTDRRRTPLHITGEGEVLLREFPFCSESDVLSVALDRLGARKSEQIASLLEELDAAIMDSKSK
jgi:DNA-binding MarR family transcriptional regulator